MDILSGLAGFFLFPVMAWWALSWWYIIGSGIFFCFFIFALVPSEWEDHTGGHATASAVLLLITFLIVSLGVGNHSEVTGFWASIWVGTKYFFMSALAYVVCGIFTLLPLWYVNVRRIGESMRNEFRLFVERALEMPNMGNANSDDIPHYFKGVKNFLTSTDKEEVRSRRGMKDGKIMPCLMEMHREYKNHMYFRRSIYAKDNLGLIASLIFLWPAHVVIETIGEFIAKIPEHIARIFKGPLNMISKMVVKDLPEELKGE